MAKQLSVSISDWVWDAIELKRVREQKGRSELVDELLAKALKVSVNID